MAELRRRQDGSTAARGKSVGVKILIAGEGPNEIGGWATAAPYRASAPSPGVIEALLRQIRSEGWTIEQGWLWKSVRKYKVRPQKQPETQTVLGLALAAHEAGCNVLAFVRDEDHDAQRTRAISAGMREASSLWPQLRIAGSTAAPCLEAWLLEECGLPRKDTAAMVALVDERGLVKIPLDAAALCAWISNARAALTWSPV